MKNKITQFLNKYICYIAPPLFTLLILLMAFYMRGVFPFGNHDAGYYDMLKLGVPRMEHVWNAIHSNKVSSYFNWYSGMGAPNNAFSFSFFVIILPFIKKSAISSAMSFYVIISYCLSSLSAALFFKKVTKAGRFFVIFLSVCYAFCGFSLLYYINMWQDSVILFPVFLLFWHRMLNGGKVLPLIIVTAINYLCDYYIATLVLIYMFFISFAYIVLLIEKEQRKKVAFNLGLSILFGIALSAIFVLPKYVQVATSDRFLNGSGMFSQSILSTYLDRASTGGEFTVKSFLFFIYKLFSMFTLCFPLLIIVFGMKAKTDKAKNRFFGFAIFVLLSLCVCEGTDILFHLGDYNGYPMRMSFAMVFVILWGAAEYSAQLGFKGFKFDKSNAKKILLSIIVSVILFSTVALLMYYLITHFSVEFSLLVLIPILSIIFIILYSLREKHLDYRSAIAVLLAEVLMLSVVFIPYNTVINLDGREFLECNYQALKVKEDFKIPESKTERVKNIGATLDLNYGVFLNKATVAGYTSMEAKETSLALHFFGYSYLYTRHNETGGTAFSDAFLGIKNLLSVKEESNKLYSFIDSNGKYNYYKCNYTMPFGVVGNDDILNYKINDSWKDNQNYMYNSLSNDNEDIVSDSNIKLISKNKNTEIYNFESKANTEAYLELEGANGANIYVNGKLLEIPSVGQTDNCLFPANLDLYLLRLGEFGDSTVELKLVLNKGKYEDNPKFRQNDDGEYHYQNRNYFVDVGLLDLNKLQSVCAEKTQEMQGVKVNAENCSLTINNVQGEEGKALLIPIQYVDNIGWKATVNGEKTKLYQVNGFMCGVKLKDGLNNISLKFTPPGLYTGIIVSLTSIVLYALYELLKNRIKRVFGVMETIVYRAYSVAFVLGVAAVFVIPFFVMFIL